MFPTFMNLTSYRIKYIFNLGPDSEDYEGPEFSGGEDYAALSPASTMISPHQTLPAQAMVPMVAKPMNLTSQLVPPQPKKHPPVAVLQQNPVKTKVAKAKLPQLMSPSQATLLLQQRQAEQLRQQQHQQQQPAVPIQSLKQPVKNPITLSTAAKANNITPVGGATGSTLNKALAINRMSHTAGTALPRMSPMVNVISHANLLGIIVKRDQAQQSKR